MSVGLVALAVIAVLIVSISWWYLGTMSFAEFVRLRIERTLEGRLGREVTIESVEIIRSRPQRVILRNLRIANAPGGAAPAFAQVAEVEIAGGIESFWRREVRVSRVDVRDPKMWFEVFPEGASLVHNFPRWQTGPPRSFEIVRLEIGELFVRGGEFSFNDRRRNIVAEAAGIASDVTITRAEGLYAGVMSSPRLRVRLQDYEPFDLQMRGGFRYTPGILALESIALRGDDIEAFISGKLDPLTEGAYDLRIASKLGLEKVREIFRVDAVLEGSMALDTRLQGSQGEFRMTGGWTAPRILADAYELSDARGTLDLDGEKLALQVESAAYAGGTIKADYLLSQYAEPYPMKVNLGYDRISIEHLFSDWGLRGTGLRGAATGSLNYRWNKNDLLDGSGEGTARLSRSVAFSEARYPVPVAGSTDFAIERGVVRFRSAQLETESSNINFAGTLGIEGMVMNLRADVRSTDFAELDRIGLNFAHAADNLEYGLLGLGGAGTITATLRGPLEQIQVAANISGSGTRYSDVLLGDAEIALTWDGARDQLAFEDARFTYQGGVLVLNGTVVFPDSGPGPRFDLAVEANGYPAQRAIDAMGLELQIGPGIATGRMLIAGTPENGRATFAGLTIRRAEATLVLNGSMQWLPGEGNVVFDLQIAARNFPVTDIATFFEFDVPLTGALTGTLNLTGPKSSLEGSGSVTVSEGSIFGEPVEMASADIEFTAGRMRATSIVVQSAAGELRGEAEFDLGTERFSYSITSASIDLSRLEALSAMRTLLGGRVILTSVGAGSFDAPELMVEATLTDATIQGLTLPEGTPPPSFYLAIRGGQLIVRGSIGDIVSIEGGGTVGDNLSVDGNIRVTIADLARALMLSPQTATLPGSGTVVLDLRLGGRLSPIEALVVEATAPVFEVRIADHEFTTPEPLRIALRNGRIEFDSFELRRPDSTFAVTGFAEVTGERRLNLDVSGRIEAALAQLFMSDVRADGFLDLSVKVDGTMTSPNVVGVAEVRDAQVRFAGFPQLIDQINGRLRFRGDQILIESLRATVGGGSVVAGGSVTLDGMQMQSARITLQGNSVALRYYEGVTVEGNFTLLLTGGSEGAVLQGDIDVTRGLYFRDFDLQQTLLNLILARDRVAAVSSATWEDRLALRLRLNAPDTLAVRNNIADVTGSAVFDVTGTLANPVVLGELTLDEGGSVRIQNIDYRVVRGTVAFQNPFRIDPFFDVTVEGRVSSGATDLESGQLQITVNLTGTLDRMTPTITSDPPASDITLFSILGFGGLGGSGPPGGVGVLGQSLLYSSLSSLIGSRVFPFVDAFTYDPGNLDAGGAGPRVTFEKRISNSVRFLLVYNLANNQNREVIEWMVNPEWTLQLVRDMTGDYRLDARVRRQYEAHWRIRDEERQFAQAAVMVPSGTQAGEMAAAASAVATAPLPAVTAVDPLAARDQLIERIVFRADAAFETSALTDEVPLRSGEPLTIKGVQSSIRNLFGTGNFRDIRVDASPGDNGVVVTFSLYLHYRVGEIEIEGLGRTDRTRARRDLTLRTGQIFSLDSVDTSAEAIESMLNRHGYLEVTVDPETEFDRSRSIADVSYQVTLGPRATVAEVIIEGDLAPFTAPELIAQMRRRPGRTFHLLDARDDAGRMQTFLVRRNYRRADATFVGHTYDAENEAVTLRYRVDTGPRVQVEVAGINRRAVRRWLPFGRTQEYSEDVVDRAASRITEGLQQRGHYLATVDTESAQEDGLLTTTFHVDAGPRFRLGSVEFVGNEVLPEDELRDVVETFPRGGFRRFLQTLLRRPIGVTREQLADDRNAIESYYRLSGFSEATASTPIVTPRADGTLHVAFPLSEGPQTIVSSLAIEGPEAFSRNEIPRQGLEEGGPLNPQQLQDDVVALQTFYAEKGYVEVQVAPRVERSEDRRTASVTYVITEGPQVNIGNITVRGNSYTNREVITRQSELEPGDPFSYTSVLEAQRQLYRLGIFNRIEVLPQQTGTDVTNRDIVLQVEEGRNLTLTGAVGLRLARATEEGGGSEFRERLAAAAAHRNLFGTGRYLGVEGVYSGQEQDAFITYREPFISRWNVPLQVQLFQSDDSTRRGTRILQRGASLEVTKVARLQTRWSLRYEYRITDCVGGELCATIDGIPVEGLDRSLLDIQISSFTPTFFWDTRDDIIDPRRGFFTSASIEYAFPLISADANFLKEYVQGAWFRPLSSNTVLALSGRIGLIQPLGGTTSNDVPLSERFTAGGETTHRGFALDRLGDLCREADTTPIAGCMPTLYQRVEDGAFAGPLLPIGGSGLLLLNAEYRFPVFGPVGGAIFVDAGNVFAEDTIRFDKLRYGAGIGVRYLSPVGPLRFDIGRPLDRRHYDNSFQFFLTLGYAF
ncbi:MAG TPA: translocation/assembly module TamB domain-containing protein [Thermoanaerobaculia bacterium]